MLSHRQRGSTFRRKLPDGTRSTRWSIKWRNHEGRQIVEVVGTKKREAAALLEKRLAALRTGAYQAEQERPVATFAAYATQWLEARKPHLKPSTFRSYAALLGLLEATRQRRGTTPITTFGAMDLAAIRSERLAAYLASLTEAGVLPKSVNNCKTLLSTVFEDAKASGYITENPMRSRLVKAAKVMKPTDREVRIVPTADQVSALLNHLATTDDRLFAFCFTLAATGARPGEIAALQAKHLAPAVGTIAITQSFDPRAETIGLPKNGQTRDVDAGPAVFAALAALSRQGDPADSERFLLGEADGTPLQFERVRKQWATIQAAAGCGSWPLYSLRHFAASRMLQERESIAYVSKQLGHASQNMTFTHYSKFIPDTRRERGADRLAKELLRMVPMEMAAAS